MNRTRVKSICKDSVLIALISLCLLLLTEGLFSFLIVFYNLSKNPQVIAENFHTEYDSVLGWINRENCIIQDMYGPGKHLRTNSQRFRNRHDFDISVPEGKRRWICAGDSFTLGYGVDNDHTWCSLLTSNIPNLETVNMGQGGYGIDQAYLWYMRDGVGLQHDVLVFAFITYDFDRMTRSHSGGNPRPRLCVSDGRVIQQNFPVPRPGFLARSLPRYRSAIRQLSIVRMTDFLRRKIQGSNSDPESETMELALSIIGELNTINNHSDQTVLLVHLPTREDFRSPEISGFWREFLRSQAGTNQWNYIDLIEDFRDLNPESVPELFIQNDLPGFIASSGHYTEKGNQYIADLLVKKIASTPSIRGLVRTPE